jgi:hypothetical protein
MSWSRLDLEPGQGDDFDSVLRLAWAIPYDDAFLNYRCGVFRRFLEAGRSTLYFSPAARELGDAFGAKLCDPPDRAGLRLVAGDGRSWDSCFPRADCGRPARASLHLPARPRENQVRRDAVPTAAPPQ